MSQDGEGVISNKVSRDEMTNPMHYTWATSRLHVLENIQIKKEATRKKHGVFANANKNGNSRFFVV